MINKKDLKVFTIRNEIYEKDDNSARVILFNVGDRFFLFRGIQYFKINSERFEEVYEEITNRTIIDNLISVHNETIEEVKKRGIKEIEPERFKIIEEVDYNLNMEGIDKKF